jgi:hypothetical protein
MIRRTLTAAGLLGCLLCAVTPAGTLKGTVTAQGKDSAETSAHGSHYDSRKWKFVQRVDYPSLVDFVVYVDQAFPGTNFALPREPPRIVQKDACFSPHVTPVLVGTGVAFPNVDEIFHNVFSFSDPKPFDLGLYKDDVKTVIFDKVGRVDVFCSIHKDMHCVVLVLPNPYFALTDADGTYTIRDLPAGTYTIRAWHERLPPQTREIVVPADGTVTADFTMGITGLPQY